MWIIIIQRKKEISENKTGVIYTVLSSFLRFEDKEKEIEMHQIKYPEELIQKEQRGQCYFRA